MTLFERIKETAKDQGLNLQQVAEKAGLSSNMIYQYKTVNPKLGTLKLIADVLNVSVDYLLGNTDEKNPHPAKSEDKEVDLEDDSIILKFDGQEISDEYRDFIIDQIRQIRKMRGN